MLHKELRARAEHVFRLTRHDVDNLANDDVQRLVHELQVHQIELEMQNESLCHAQLDVEKSQEQYQALFDHAPVAYFMLDADGVVARANSAALSLFGVSLTRLLGQPLSAYIARKDLVLFHERLGRARRDGRASCEVRVSEATGSVVCAQLDISVLPGPAPGCLVALTDISDRKHSHEALERLNQELEARVASRTAELAARNRLLEAEILGRAESEAQRRGLEARLRESERFESLGLIAAGIAHDFNNLLVGVMGNAELMLRTPGLTENWRVPLSRIELAGRQASDLTHQLLVFAGLGALSTAAVSLPCIVGESLELLKTGLPTNVQIQAEISAELPAIEADSGQVSQLVMNLVTNAIEALDGCGVVAIRTTVQRLSAEALGEFQHAKGAKPGSFGVLCVQDSGSGIDAATITRIFDPFFSTKFSGRGLGLASVLGIVQGHRGAMRVRSSPGEGTCFEIALPLAEPRASSQPPAQRDPAGDAVASGPVLLVDDDDGVRTVVAQLLECLGFDVTIADSGQAALDLFRRPELQFDLVVMDWMMPGLSGEQMLKALRESAPELPVILISGYNAGELASNDQRVARVQSR